MKDETNILITMGIQLQSVTYRLIKLSRRFLRTKVEDFVPTGNERMNVSSGLRISDSRLAVTETVPQVRFLHY